MTRPVCSIPMAPAGTHAEAAALFRRPFAPGAIGFRAMTKVPYQGVPYAGAQVAAYLGVQAVMQRLNAVVPGRWHQQFQSVPAELIPAGTHAEYYWRLIICSYFAHFRLQSGACRLPTPMRRSICARSPL